MLETRTPAQKKATEKNWAKCRVAAALSAVTSAQYNGHLGKKSLHKLKVAQRFIEEALADWDSPDLKPRMLVMGKTKLKKFYEKDRQKRGLKDSNG